MNKKLLFALVSSVVALVVILTVVVKNNQSENDKKAGGKKPPPQVRVAKIEIGSISRTLSLTGSVESVRTARLASPSEGPVERLYVREGDEVKKRDLLAIIGRRAGTNATVGALREEEKKEKDNLARVEQLVEIGALPGEQLDEARSRYESVRARRIEAEERYRDHRIVAPWNGLISRVLVSEGDFANLRTPLVEMFDPVEMVIRVAVPEKFAADVKEEMSGRVSLDSYPKANFNAKISRVYPNLDERTRTRTVEVKIIEDISLLPGMFARVELALEKEEEAVVAPNDAIRSTANDRKVVFVVEEGKAIRRVVETGIEQIDRVQILSGVAAGERVVIAGQESLTDGLPVRVIGANKEADPKGPRR